MLDFLNRDPTKLPHLQDAPQDGTAPLGFFVSVLMVGCVLASLVGLFMGAYVVCAWAIGGAFALYFVGRAVQ